MITAWFFGEIPKPVPERTKVTTFARIPALVALARCNLAIFFPDLILDNSYLRGFQNCVVCWCVMVAVQSLGVPSQVTTEYRARARGMRVRTTVGRSREASTQGLKFAKNLDNAEKSQKNPHFDALAERILE